MFSLTTRNSGSKTSSNHNRVYFRPLCLVLVHCSRLQRPLPPTQKKKNPILVNRYQVKLTAIVTSQLYTLIRKDNGFSWVCRPTVAACVFKQRGRGGVGGGQLLQRLISRTTSCLFRGCFFYVPPADEPQQQQKHVRDMRYDVHRVSCRWWVCSVVSVGCGSTWRPQTLFLVLSRV